MRSYCRQELKYLFGREGAVTDGDFGKLDRWVFHIKVRFRDIGLLEVNICALETSTVTHDVLSSETFTSEVQRARGEGGEDLYKIGQEAHLEKSFNSVEHVQWWFAHKVLANLIFCGSCSQS